MERKLNGSSLFWVLLKMNILPIVLLTLVIMTFSATRFANSMNKEVQNGMKNLCDTVATIYDIMYEGDYCAVEHDGAIYMLKGDHQLNGDFAIIDAVKEKTDVDITFFYKDTRVITTIADTRGNRAIGTRASAVVIKDVLEQGKASFYTKTSIEGEGYFAYYTPLYDAEGTIIGMLFVGKPSAEVEALVHKSVNPIILIGILTMVLACLITIRFSNQLVEAIRKIETFLEKVAGGDLRTEFNPAVLKRTDELGEMGRYIVRMQRSLRELVEQDILTKLNNRRSGEKLLKQTQEKYEKSGIPFCVVIGDVDHFKQVNDTYGHENGDKVLIEVSSILKRNMRGKGFVSRWGGEEFLLVFEDTYLEEAVQELQVMLDDIRNMSVETEEEHIRVTMTFGVVQGSEDKLDHILKDADAKLYFGKNNGRNQIVQ